jgi:tryprostatin B 6-hydroxylase
MEPLLALSAGIFSHLVFFKIGERHLYPFRYVQAFILAFAGISMAKSNFQGLSIGAAVNQTALLAAFYFTGLYLSLIIYRLFFNPLNKFPGPYGARLSKFDFVFRVTKMDGHHKLYAMHRKYGKFVRIGPNDLSVSDPDGVQIVQGLNSKCTKAQWYSQDTPLISMHTTRDKATHDRRRRIWSPAFSDKALRGYESRVQRYNDMFIKQMDELAGMSVSALERGVHDKLMDIKVNLLMLQNGSIYIALM